MFTQKAAQLKPPRVWRDRGIYPENSLSMHILRPQTTEEESVSFKKAWDFPGGTVVKNPPANAGDMGSSSGPGRCHMLWSN